MRSALFAYRLLLLAFPAALRHEFGDDMAAMFSQQIDPFPAWEIALAMVATSYIWRHVDPDRPARTVIRTALTDWRRGGTDSGTERRLPRLVARRVRVREKLS